MFLDPLPKAKQWIETNIEKRKQSFNNKSSYNKHNYLLTDSTSWPETPEILTFSIASTLANVPC